MKKIGVFSYRVKLILIWCVVILLATGMVSLGLTYNATRQMLEDQKAHLELLTEQVLINFINQTEAVARQLNNQVNSTGLSAQLYAMRDMTADSAGYYHATQSLLYALNQTITTQSGYDAVYLRLDRGNSFTTSYASAGFRQEAAALMDANFTLAAACLSMTCFELTDCESVTVISGTKQVTILRDSWLLLDDFIPAEPTKEDIT